MITFELNNKKFNFPESWEEVNLKQYIEIGKLQEQRTEFLYQELYLLRLLEVLTDVKEGELDDLSIEDINKLGSASLFVSKMPEMNTVKELKIGETLYTPPDDLTKLTIGEFISLKTYQDSARTFWDAVPDMLAILWRPSEKVIDNETGKEKFIREKFKVENLQFRRELFLEQPAINIFGPLLFFSLMNGGFTPNSKVSINQKVEELRTLDPDKSQLITDTVG